MEGLFTIYEIKTMIFVMDSPIHVNAFKIKAPRV